MIDGVMHLYESEQDKLIDNPMPLPYLDRDVFMQDQMVMLTLIADGPL